jgi:hypothetical protein
MEAFSPSSERVEKEETREASVEQAAREVEARAEEALAEGERDLASARAMEAELSPKEAESAEREAGMPELPAIRGEIRDTADLAARSIREVAGEARDPALDRLNRELRAGEAIAKLERGEDLGEGERNMLRGLLESRGWYKLFTRLKPGDALATFLVPSGETFSIKNLNDNIFGPEKTDAIIEYRRAALRNRLEELGLEELSQSFRDGFFHIPKEQQSAALLERLQAAAELTSEDVTRFITDVLDAEGRAANADRQNMLAKFRAELTHPEKGYRMTLGAGMVGAQQQEGDYTHVELAISASLKAALQARELGDGAFESEDAEAAVNRVRALRAQILLSSRENRIQNEEGEIFPLFHSTDDGYQQLNLDVIRDLRKGTFVPAPGQERVHALLKEYLKEVNLFDLLKPYTHEEVAGEDVHGTTQSLQEMLANTARYAHALAEDQRLSAAERAEIVAELKQEGRDRACTSAVEFHDKALKIADCAYVSLDVLDVGPKLLQEFERLFQEVERGRKTFEEASLSAGDETTRQMREFRATVMRVAREHGADERPLMLVGGDEATLALPSELVTDELLLALRVETGSRVVKTVVAAAERHSDLSHPDDVKREHIAARKRAESGTEAAKEIEATVRELRRIQEDIPPGSKKTFAQRFSELRLDAFAVIERRNSSGFDVMLRETEQGKSSRFTLDALRERFEELKQLAKQEND